MFHVNLDGKTMKCNAKKGGCPFGGDRHFKDEDEAHKFAQSELEATYATIPKKMTSYTNEEFQDLVMGANELELNNYETAIAEEIEDLKGLTRILQNAKKKMIEHARDGVNYTEKSDTERIERENKILEEKRNNAILAKAFSEKEFIEIPASAKRYIKNKKWARVNTSAFRGQSNKDVAINNGLAIYGQGIYSSTKKSYAKKYGDVREVSIDELPVKPLQFDNALDFSQFEYEVAEANGLSKAKNEMYSHMEVDEMIWKMGYDGVVINDGEIIVNFDTEYNRKKYDKKS